VGFEPTIPATERPKTHTLDGAATGIDEDKATLHVISYTFTKITDKFQNPVINY
jgi:hypothetical protein